MAHMLDRRLLVVTAAKNEANYLPTTIASMMKQSVLPSQWIVVDDGSTDGTAEIADAAARSASWITVLRTESNQRRVGVATVQALDLALQHSTVPDWDFLCVVDADVDLPNDYFRCLLAEFERRPKLGIGAGQIYEKGADGKLRRMRGAPGATAGAIKCWRRECFEEMGRLIEEPGWDGIDQYQAAMRGWSTQTFDGDGFSVLHLRPVGSSDRGVLRGRSRRGRSGYFMGSHPLWMLASAMFHIGDSPFILGSLFTLKGYFTALWSKDPKINNPELIAFIRRSQLSALRARLAPWHHLPTENEGIPTCHP
jgi:glycosyltransferase involved in cell wall biosynthesis